MKNRQLIAQVLCKPVARVGVTSMIALMGWVILTPQAQAGFGRGVQGLPPNDSEVTRGSGIGITEGSDILGNGTILPFDPPFNINLANPLAENVPLPGNVITNIAGGGSLQDLENLVGKAGDVWETALPGFDDIQLNIAWADFGLQALAESSQLSPSDRLLVEQFQDNQNTFLLTSKLNTSIDSAFNFLRPESGSFIPTPIITDNGFLNENDLDLLYGLSTSDVDLEAEIDEFEKTFITLDRHDTEMDGLVAIFVPAIFEEGETIELGDSFPSGGTIIFNSQDLVFDLDRDGTEETIKFFLDNDPLNSDVFGDYTNFTEEFGTGSLNGINIGRSSFADNSQFPIDNDDDVLVIDLFSVVLHELQHALGTTRTNQAAVNEIQSNGNSNIVTADGAEIPTDFEPYVHIDLNNGSNTLTPVSNELIDYGERKCPSAVDILAVAEVGNFENGELELNPCRALALATPVPESSNILPLLLFGMGGLAMIVHRS